MKTKKLIIYLILLIFILSGCENFEEIYSRKQQWTLIEENIYSFEDGQYVDLRADYIGGTELYKLPIGKILLVVKENRQSIGLDVNKKAEKVIDEYYKKQGLLYDVNTEIEKAYSYYLQCKENNKDFTASELGQEFYIAGQNEKILCIVTLVRIPLRELGVFNSPEIKLNAIFNKDTGEIYNTWDLFYSSREETIERLIKSAEITDENLMREISESIKAEYISLESGYLVIDFPRGSISTEEGLYNLSIPYEKLDGVIKEWAIPHTEEMPVY